MADDWSEERFRADLAALNEAWWEFWRGRLPASGGQDRWFYDWSRGRGVFLLALPDGACLQTSFDSLTDGLALLVLLKASL